MRGRLRTDDPVLTMQFDRDSNEFDRSLGFFDATYAFALTLLILNIDLPSADDWETPGSLIGAVGWQAAGFLISFVVIVVFWMSNQGIISRLRVLDRGTIILNIVGIGLVVVIPFTTQAISEPALGELPLPTVVYALNCALVIIVSTIMYERAMAKGFGKLERSARTRRWELIDSLANPAVFLLSIPFAFVFGGEARLVWLLMIPLGFLTGPPRARAEAADLAAMRAKADAAAASSTEAPEG